MDDLGGKPTIFGNPHIGMFQNLQTSTRQRFDSVALALAVGGGPTGNGFGWFLVIQKSLKERAIPKFFEFFFFFGWGVVGS